MAGAQMTFKDRAAAALSNPSLKAAIERTAGTAERNRAAAVDRFTEFAAARARGRQIKDHVIANLDHYLLEFEKNAIASGARVHWARTAEEAALIVTGICKAAGVKRVTRSKSMLGEEIGLPAALDNAGIERVETDLAEHIVQLAGETPSHIVWPAMHKRREEVATLFRARHAHAPASDDIPEPRRKRAPGTAQQIPDRRCWHHGRELSDRGHGRGLHGHERGQCRAYDNAAAHSHCDRGH